MRCLTCSLALLALLTAPLSAADANLESLEEQAFKQAAALVNDCIVKIQTQGGLDQVGQVLTSTGPTTGVIVSPDGYIISSSFSFASKPATILVTLPGTPDPFVARVIASDNAKMLTLLKVDDVKDLPVPAVAKKADIRVGEWALALGRTYSFEVPNLSVGIISATNRIWGKALQTDAKISPSNYGGPIVNIKGEVQGILVPLSTQGEDDTAGVEWYDSGIGFAIPMEDVLANLDRLKSGTDLEPGLLGITLKGKDLLAEQPVIDRVRTLSPADTAGFLPGDIIQEIDGEKIQRQLQLKHALGTRYAGDTIKLTVKRGEETVTADVKLVAKLVAYESGYLGILPTRNAVQEPAAGVVISQVLEGSPAATAGLKSLDKITKVGDQEVQEARGLLDQVSRARPGDKLTLTYEREGQAATVEVTLAKIPNEVPKQLRAQAIPPLALEGEAAKNAPKTGRINVDMEAQDHSYWAYIPEGYNPEYQYSLMVWIHPNGDTMEAAMIKDWKSLCDRRGIILLAPKAEDVSNWNANEAEFVNDAVKDLSSKYTIDPQRVWLHSYGTAGLFTYDLCFKYRDTFRGVAVAGAPMRKQPEETDPDYRLQIFLCCGDQDPQFAQVQRTAQFLEGMKYPVVFTRISGASDTYPEGDTLDQIATWADLLDRI